MSRPVVLLLVLGALVVGTAGAVLGIALSRDGEALPGVTVEDIDVGGLGPDDLRAELSPLVEARTTTGVVVEHEGEEFPIDPQEVGVDLDLDALVERTLLAGRDVGGPRGLVRELRGVAPGEVDLAVDADVDPAQVRPAVQAIADELDTAVEDGSVEVDPATLEVAVVLPAPGLRSDVDATTETVVERLVAGDDTQVELVAEVLPQRMPTAQVEGVAELFRGAVAEPLVLTGGGSELVLEPGDVARLLSTREAGTDEAPTLELAVTEDAVEDVLAEQVDVLLTTPVSARFVAPSSPPVRFDDKDDAAWRPVRDVGVEVVPGTEGTRFDPEAAADQLEVVLAEGTRQAELRLAVREAELTTEQARAYGVDDLLSTFTTYHVCCQPRVVNIHRLADVVDDTTVLPGEQFSINGLSGERTCGKGYAEDGMILDGEIVDVCGGGVSQFGTTTVNAVFFAGIDPDAYKPHSFYISRYPMAREATLNWPNLDVAWTNDTGAPVIVTTNYSSTAITVSFWGNADDLTEVRADVGSPGSIRPFPKVRRQNSELPPGTTTQVQGGRDGFSVGLTRTVVRPSGTSTDDWSNTYVPETEITEFNPAS